MEYKQLHNSEFKECLDRLMVGHESALVEFKHGLGGFPHMEFRPSYSAFANTNRGLIVIGVKEKHCNFYTEGLSHEIVEQYEKIFWDSVNDPKQVSRRLMTNINDKQ